MFRHFSFEPASSHLPTTHEAERAMNVSPCSPPPSTHHASPPPTPPHCSIGDLANQFHQHNLHVQVDPDYQCYRPCYEPLTPPSDDHAFPVELLDHPQQTSLYPRLSATLLRKQRQANTRLQSSSSHMHDISMLVQRMIDDESQCRIRHHKSSSPTWSTASSVDDDEGVDMEYNPPTPPETRVHNLKYRRSGDGLNSSAAVLKSVRMRKKSGISKRT